MICYIQEAGDYVATFRVNYTSDHGKGSSWIFFDTLNVSLHDFMLISKVGLFHYSKNVHWNIWVNNILSWQAWKDVLSITQVWLQIYFLNIPPVMKNCLLDTVLIFWNQIIQSFPMHILTQIFGNQHRIIRIFILAIKRNSTRTLAMV